MHCRRVRPGVPTQSAALVLLLLSSLLLTGCSVDSVLRYGFDSVLDELGPLLGGMRVLFAIAGLALLLVGWKIYRFIIAVPGLLIGAALGAGLGYGANENWLLAILGLGVGAVVGAGLALLLHDLAVWLIGALIGVVVVGALYGALSGGDVPPLLVIIIAGLLGGGALLALAKAWIVVLSSIIGAVMLGFAVNAGAGWMVLFCLFGIAFQYGLSKLLGVKIPGPAAQKPAPVPPDQFPPQTPMDQLPPQSPPRV